MAFNNQENDLLNAGEEMELSSQQGNNEYEDDRMSEDHPEEVDELMHDGGNTENHSLQDHDEELEDVESDHETTIIVQPAPAVDVSFIDSAAVTSAMPAESVGTNINKDAMDPAEDVNDESSYVDEHGESFLAPEVETHPIHADFGGIRKQLFPIEGATEKDQPECFLDDHTLLHKPLKYTFDALRDVLLRTHQLDHSQSIYIWFNSLGCGIDHVGSCIRSRTVSADFDEVHTLSCKQTMAKVLHVYLRMASNDGVDAPEPMLIRVSALQSFQHRMEELRDMAKEGQGLQSLLLEEEEEDEQKQETKIPETLQGEHSNKHYEDEPDRQHDFELIFDDVDGDEAPGDNAEAPVAELPVEEDGGALQTNRDEENASKRTEGVSEQAPSPAKVDDVAQAPSETPKEEAVKPQKDSLEVDKTTREPTALDQVPEEEELFDWSDEDEPADNSAVINEPAKVPQAEEVHTVRPVVSDYHTSRELPFLCPRGFPTLTCCDVWLVPTSQTDQQPSGASGVALADSKTSASDVYEDLIDYSDDEETSAQPSQPSSKAVQSSEPQVSPQKSSAGGAEEPHDKSDTRKASKSPQEAPAAASAVTAPVSTASKPALDPHPEDFIDYSDDEDFAAGSSLATPKSVAPDPPAVLTDASAATRKRSLSALVESDDEADVESKKRKAA